MDPLSRAQVLLLCDTCKTAHLQSCCELCRINLCRTCAGDHLSDTSKRHNVVPYKYRKPLPKYSKCTDHAEQHCKHYCEKCDIPVCSTCVSSGRHKDHNILNILKKFSEKTQSLQNDLAELETGIYFQYENMASDIQTEKAELETNYRTLTTAADQQGEVWHREINVIVNQRKSDIQEMKNKHLSSLNKNTDQITQKIMELKQIISDLKSMLKSNDASLTSTYKSRNSEFRTLVPKVGITLPRFFPQKMNKDRLSEMFGSLSPLSINTENSPEAISSPLVKPLLDEPRLTATIDTRYASLFNVTCLSEEVWTCGDSKILQLLNLQGKLLTSIETESGVTPYDIAVTLDGDLVYTDTKTKTVNIVKNKQIQIMITIQGWRPISVCSTSSDDLLVFMVSNDFQQSKVVRYSDSKETQTIQFNDQGQPLYSHEYNKYICENRNLDICVSDFSASAVVVVNQSGRLRFRYMGHSSDTEKSFKPRGITTDSQSHILTSDCDNDRIHILDQDGHFLCYIQNCDLKRPYGLCVDIRDNLFVAERHTAKVKKIQYI